MTLANAGAEADAWTLRYLANEEMVNAELPTRSEVLAGTFDLDRLWGPHEGHLLPDDLPALLERDGYPPSLTLLRTWLHEHSRSYRSLTQDSAEPAAKALLDELARAVRDRVATAQTDDETHFIAQQLSSPNTPITWSVYDDPAGRLLPSLLTGLMSQPATQSQHPIENQFSEALAFLISRWPSFGARFASLCGHEDDRQLHDAIAGANVIGTRTRVSLPVSTPDEATNRGFLFPDISIEGSDRAFQILLEVKVDADLHHATVGGELLLQPDAYAAAWRRIQDPAPARTRRICTLTRESVDLDAADPMRRASITWAETAEMVATERAAGVPAELALIVDELHQAISDRILPAVTDKQEFARVCEVAAPLLDALAATMTTGFSGTTRASPVLVGEDFVRRYVYLQVQGQPLQLLARLSPAGGKYNLPGMPATIALQFMTDSNETLPATFEPLALACGMQHSRNRAGYTGLRRFFDLPPQLGAQEAAALGVELATLVTDALA